MSVPVPAKMSRAKTGVSRAAWAVLTHIHNNTGVLGFFLTVFLQCFLVLMLLGFDFTGKEKGVKLNT